MRYSCAKPVGQDAPSNTPLPCCNMSATPAGDTVRFASSITCAAESNNAAACCVSSSHKLVVLRTRHEASELRSLWVTDVLHCALNCSLLQRRLSRARVGSQVHERRRCTARLVQRLLRGGGASTQDKSIATGCSACPQQPQQWRDDIGAALSQLRNQDA